MAKIELELTQTQIKLLRYILLKETNKTHNEFDNSCNLFTRLNGRRYVQQVEALRKLFGKKSLLHNIYSITMELDMYETEYEKDRKEIKQWQRN
jgi:hypothetical protein